MKRAPIKHGKAHVQQDPRADPKDHIIRVEGRNPFGTALFGVLQCMSWVGNAVLFRRFWKGPRALLNVQALLVMDGVRALRHVFWSLYICNYVIPPSLAVLVPTFNFLGTSLQMWLATKAGPKLASKGHLPALVYSATGLFALGSFLETFSELQRRKFKKHSPSGTLYTGGLFRYARNINYTGNNIHTCSFLEL